MKAATLFSQDFVGYWGHRDHNTIGLTQPNYVEVKSGLLNDDPVVDPFNPDLKERQSIS